MRSAIARRITICAQCKSPIPIGEHRLDDVIKTPSSYRRIHYHPGCFYDKMDSWYEQHQNDPIHYNHAGGRPPSDLTEDEKAARQKLLIKLSNLWAYYLPKLDLQTPHRELSYEQLRMLNNFNLRFKQFAGALEPIGGLPKRYQQVQPREVVALDLTQSGWDATPTFTSGQENPARLE